MFLKSKPKKKKEKKSVSCGSFYDKKKRFAGGCYIILHATRTYTEFLAFVYYMCHLLFKKTFFFRVWLAVENLSLR